MTLIEKLDYLMKEKNINKSVLSKETGIPYTTIDGFYKKGTENIKLSTLKKIAEYFEITLDELANDDIAIDNKSSTNYEYLNDMQRNDEIKMLFDAADNVSAEEIKMAIEIIKKIRNS